MKEEGAQKSVNMRLFLRDALKNPDLRTLSQLGLTHSHFGTSTIGSFELGFGPPPIFKMDL